MLTPYFSTGKLWRQVRLFVLFSFMCVLLVHLLASASSCVPVVTIHYLAALDVGTGVEQPIYCLIVQNRQAVQSMGMSMDWTLEDHRIDGLFLCTILTGRRRGHISFVKAGAETSDTGVETVKPDPRCSWQDHSRRVSGDVGDESTESRSVVQPLRIPSAIRPECRTSVVVRWTDEKWVSQFEAPCICTRWTGKRWVEQMSRFHGTAC